MDCRVPGKWDDEDMGSYGLDALCDVMRPRDVDVVRRDGAGNSRATIGDGVVERAVRVPAHHGAGQTGAEVVDRMCVEEGALDD